MPIRPIQTVDIDLDRKRTLLFNHRALRLAEVELNRARGSKPDQWLAIEDAINATIKSGRFPHDLTEILLWAGLTAHDASVTTDKAADMIVDRPYVVQKLGEAIGHYYQQSKKPDEEPAAGEDGTDRPLTDGSTDGPLPASRSV